MNFKKIKFNSKDKTLELSYSQHNGMNSNQIVNKCGQVVHSDFIDAINSLRYHFANLCDLREIDQIDERTESIDQLFQHTALKEVAVGSVVFNTDGDDNAVMLCGSKRFNGKYINFNTPLTSLTPDGYLYYWELEKALATLQEEARLYLQEQKWGIVQTEMVFGMDAEFEDDADRFAEALSAESTDTTAIAPKRGRKPKSATADQHLAN